MVLKAEVPGLVHKSDAGAVLLGLYGADEARAALPSSRPGSGAA